jgi:hypothetical protein
MRTCLFCTDSRLSQEDVLPRWLARRFPTPRGVQISLQHGSEPPSVWPKRRHEHKARFVCAKCNNGWMSDLENEVKPVIERLLADSQVRLDAADQGTLVVWSVKNTMVFEALRGDTADFYSSEERSLLRTSRAVPRWTRVWLARCAGLPGIHATGSDHASTPDFSPMGERLICITIGFGQLAIQVATLKFPIGKREPPVVHTNWKPGPWSETTLTVTVGGDPVLWPTASSLDGQVGFDAFAARWHSPAG